jgi:cellobiose phosphorylase
MVYRLKWLDVSRGARSDSGHSAHGKDITCIPKTWSSYQVTYRVGETTFQISVKNPAGVNRGVKHVELDGIILKNNAIPLVEDGRRHQVNVALG